jgi:hypothetical protein
MSIPKAQRSIKVTANSKDLSGLDNAVAQQGEGGKPEQREALCQVDLPWGRQAGKPDLLRDVRLESLLRGFLTMCCVVEYEMDAF